MKYNVISDGESDGIALFYIKDKKLKSVCLTEDEAKQLDAILDLYFRQNGVKIKTPDDLEKYL